MTKLIEHLNIYPNYALKTEKYDGFKLLKLKIFPESLLTRISFELHMALIRFKSQNIPQKYINAKELKLNIGSGPYGREGWVNIDAFPAPGVNCIYDCRKHLPFPNQSVSAIFSEHFVEHIDYTEELPYFLSECYRVLEPGGVIRIIVPDGGKYLKAYCKEGWDELIEMRPLNQNHTDYHLKCKYNTKMELINNIFRHGEEHKYAYDYETLDFLFKGYGFSTVKQQEYNKSFHDFLCIERQERASESLYVEAIK